MKKVLIIEDNLDLLDNTAELLELSNYRVYKASGGKMGIEYALENKPDIILCDIMMPDMDGYGVLHIVQNNPELQHIPFIFLSAKTELRDIRKGMSLGADDYILKPYDSTDLLNAIKKRMDKVQGLKESIHAEENHIALFNGGSIEKILAEFVDGRTIEKYKKKQRIFSEGNHPLRLYYVQKGRVKIYKTNNNGKELIVQIVEEREFFGSMAMLENTIYNESADALEDSAIVTIPRNEFEDLIHSNPRVCEKFIQMLAKYASEKEEQLLHLAYNSLRRKVADALLTVKRKDVAGEDSLTITRENLAAVAGTATESLIRTLTDFKSENLIDIHDGKIVILNAKKLEKLVN
jgi:CRP-like cAMP-binding protein/AmiR/NasT family two-component response regulator